MSTLWSGRFDSGPAEALWNYSESLSYDRRLAGDDIAGSRAHVKGLARAGLLSEADSQAILAALDQAQGEIQNGDFDFDKGDEDIHSAIERRVTEIAGDAGARLHTGRSRNDQIATDLRLFLKRELTETAARVLALQQVLLARAKGEEETPLPGLTHLQAAQTVSLAHHLMAHAWGLARDFDRLMAARDRADVSVLGAGALGGSALPLDPEFTAGEMGFSGVFDNSLDAVSDRDFVADALYALAMTGVRLSKMGEEVILWSSDGFRYVKLHDEWSTGSSMLPQKKNPDIAELARGKAGRMIGALTGFLTTLKGLPLAYNRDLQEDKEPLFDALDQANRGLLAMAGLYDTLTFDRDRMSDAAASEYLLAIDIADVLVNGGTPFRKAHEKVGALVRRAMESGESLVALAASELDVTLDVRPSPGAASLARRKTRGGAGPGAVRAQAERLENRLAAQAESLS